MIYTVTFNPSLDYIVRLDEFHTGAVNRTEYEEIMAGGKGINVSIVLHNLGYESTTLGFLAGFTGREIEKNARERGCTTDFIYIEEGISRINVKIKAQEESEINGQGPDISQKHLDSLFKKLDTLKDGDTLVLAGSIPNTLPEDIYEKIMERLTKKNIPVIVDATKDLLVNVLKYGPFLIKPNNHELEEIFLTPMDSVEKIIHHAKELQKMGAKNVLVSMAGDGAVLVSETGEVYTSKPPAGKVVNSVGAGDSMVAGFIAGFLKHRDYNEAFKMGIATGSASAFSAQLATEAEVINLLGKL